MTQPDLLVDKPSLLLLDIGGWTVDLMCIDNGRPIIGTCHSLEYGMIRCIDEVRERVRQNTGLSLTDARIEQVLAGRPCSPGGSGAQPDPRAGAALHQTAALGRAGSGP